MKKAVAVLCLVFLIFAAACSSGQSVARTKWNIGSGGRSFTEELTFNDQGRTFNQVTLDINVKLSGGTLAWEAYDPDGNLLFSDSTTGKYKKSIRMEPMPGQWILVITSTDAAGKMEFCWQGKK